MTGSYSPHEDNRSRSSDPFLPFLREDVYDNVGPRTNQPFLDKHKTEEVHKKRRHRKRHRRKHQEDVPRSSQGTDDKKCQQQLLDGFGNIIEPESKHLQKELSNDAQIYQDVTTENMPDFSWLYSDITDEFPPVQDPSITSNSMSGEPALSQSIRSAVPGASEQTKYIQDERLAIEEEIKRKYTELEELFDKISAKRRRRSRRKKRQPTEEGDEVAAMDSVLLTVRPIRRNRRLAQPIRNAVLIRSSMKKAWKGALGSCCGMGCWATWKWVNLKYVMSDYE